MRLQFAKVEGKWCVEGNVGGLPAGRYNITKRDGSQARVYISGRVVKKQPTSWCYEIVDAAEPIAAPTKARLPTGTRAIFSGGAHSGNYATEVANAISAATQSVCIANYLFSFHDEAGPVAGLTELLIRTAKRGVHIRIALNNTEAFYAATRSAHGEQTLTNLKAAGVGLRWYTQAGQLHAKILLVDQAYVLVGSHNLTQAAATYNAEASIATDDRSVIRDMQSWFEITYNQHAR